MRIFLALLVALLVLDIVAGQGNRRKNKRGSKGDRRPERGSKGDRKQNRDKPKSTSSLLRNLRGQLKKFEKEEKERDGRIEDRINVAIENMTQTVLAMSDQLMMFTKKDDGSQEILNRINEISRGISDLDSFAKEIQKTIEDMKKMEKGLASNHGAHPNVPDPMYIAEEPPFVPDPPVYTASDEVYTASDEDDYEVGSGAEGAVPEQEPRRARMMGSGSGDGDILTGEEGSGGSGPLDVEEAGEYEGSSSGQYNNFGYSDYFVQTLV